MDMPHLALLTVAALTLPLDRRRRANLRPLRTVDTQLLLDHRSAFAEYRAYQDPSIADWRATNDEVARVGGHVGIFGGASHAGHAAEKGSSASAITGQGATAKRA